MLEELFDLIKSYDVLLLVFCCGFASCWVVCGLTDLILVTYQFIKSKIKQLDKH